MKGDALKHAEGTETQNILDLLCALFRFFVSASGMEGSQQPCGVGSAPLDTRRTRR